MNAKQRKALRIVGGLVFWLSVLGLTGGIGWALYTYLYVPDPELLLFNYDGTEIKLLEPRAFYLTAAAPLILAMQWFNLTDFHWTQKGLNILLRWGLLAALVAALSRPSISDFDSRLCTVYLIDVSESVPDEVLTQAREVVQEGFDARQTNRVQLITFAQRPEVVPIGPGTERIPDIVRHEGEDAGLGSNPSAALRVSYGLCPQDHIRRVVLITDGNQNRGDLLAEAATAEEFEVRLYTHEIDFEAEPEVFVRSFEPESASDVRLSEPFNFTLELYSNRDTTVNLNLTQNGFRDIRGMELEVPAGISQHTIPAEVYEPGFRQFELQIVPDGPDRFDENNDYTYSITVEGRPQVLYVEGESRSRSYLSRALDRERNDLANFDLEVRGPYGFPTSVEEMANFDMIIMSDVDSQYISRSTMRNIESYVRTLGGGFLMVGGEHSFGPGGYDNTPLEDISPVTFDMQRQRDMPSLAIMLVIDRSGSMDGLNMEMAKDAAKAVVDLLGPQDYVGVIAFDDVPETYVRMQPASNRSRIRADIGRIMAGGGTDIFPALSEAYIEMLGTPARIKHVIVLTDGQAPWDGIADISGSMRADGITVSSVAVGRGADRSLLEMIAELGGGRFYATNDPNNIPQIFVQETSQVARTNLVEEPFRAVPVRRSQSTRGINWSSTPYLLGYVQTQARRGAEILLETELGDPLLARWRVGLGRVGVFTSDIKNRWSVEWVRSQVYPQFWAQVVRDMMRIDSEDELAMFTDVREGVAHIAVDGIDEADRFVNGLESTIEVTRPDGERELITLEQTAAGRYEAAYELPAYGSYQLQADHMYEGASFAVSFDSFTYPFPDEYLSFEPAPELGRRAAALTGGDINPAPDQIWDPGDELTEYRKELWPYALFVALVLLVLDILFRRVRFFGRKPVKWDRVLAGRA